jgi:hypothetical protein
MMANATHLNLIDRIDEKTGASVGMWRDVTAAPIEWGKLLAAEAEAEFRYDIPAELDYHVPAQASAEIGAWYRSTIQPDWCMGKVTSINGVWVEGVMTGDQTFRCTINEFSDSWERA